MSWTLISFLKSFRALIESARQICSFPYIFRLPPSVPYCSRELIGRKQGRMVDLRGVMPLYPNVPIEMQGNVYTSCTVVGRLEKLVVVSGEMYIDVRPPSCPR